MSKLMLFMGAMAMCSFVVVDAGFVVLDGQPCTVDKYPRRDVPVGDEICGEDYHTRLRCVEEGANRVLRRVKDSDGQCTDKQLCWPPNTQSAKTRTCVNGTPPKGFAQNEWGCAQEDEAMTTGFAYRCDPVEGPQWKWKCVKSPNGNIEWQSPTICKSCGVGADPNFPHVEYCDWDGMQEWNPWRPVEDETVLQKHTKRGRSIR